MTSLLPELERELLQAAQRTQPSAAPKVPRRPGRSSRRAVLVVIAVLLLVASVAVAAVTIQSGDPAPKSTGLGSPIAGPGHPLPGSARVLALRVADPAGGPAWGVRVYRTARGAACWQVGRVLNGRLGLLGRDGLLGNDGLFHELPVQNDQCRPLDGNRHLFALQHALALANGMTSSLSCRPATFARDGALDAQPTCTHDDLRFVVAGFLGPKARSVTLNGTHPTRVSAAQEGAFLYVTRAGDPNHAPPAVVAARYADGTTRRVTDVAPLETARNAPPRGPLPPGYVPPERALPSPARVRTRVRLTTDHWGHNLIYRLRFRAPVAARRYGVEYSVSLDGPTRGSGRHCEDPLHFGGFNPDSDVRASQIISIAMSPAIAFRWNRGWCPGTYHGRIILHDRKHTLDTFGFTVPRHSDAP